MMRVFFLVLARDGKRVNEKMQELKSLNVPFLIVCGENISHPNVLFRKAIGKYDAINFGSSHIPKGFEIIALNDVDTKIHNIGAALKHLASKDVSLVFARVSVDGPQKLFYRFLDFVRRRLPITASGELMLIKSRVLDKVLPLKPCKAEDSCILFKILELKHKAVFSEDCFVETQRTKSVRREEDYKRKTVAGLYQALGYTKPPYLVRLFYFLLPFACPMLLISGKSGFYWTKGILRGFVDYLRGDRTGSWKPTYME